jgi:hypothetical protein
MSGAAGTGTARGNRARLGRHPPVEDVGHLEQARDDHQAVALLAESIAGLARDAAGGADPATSVLAAVRVVWTLSRCLQRDALLPSADDAPG